jgi:chromosome partitioning protein
MITLAIANQKGGVGKTTTAVNLAAALARSYKRVLLIDMDPQGNATTGSSQDKASLERSILEVLMKEVEVEDAIIKRGRDQYDLLPANGELTAAEVELLNELMREQRLKHALMRVADEYDFAIIDCPPSLNMLTLNALVAADGVIIPVQCEFYALEGLSALLKTIRKVAQVANPRLHIAGILMTMYDSRTTLTGDVNRQLIQHFGDLVYKTSIPRNVRLAEAPSHGVSILEYDKDSKGAIAYMGLAAELMRRHQTTTNSNDPEAANVT